MNLEDYRSAWRDAAQAGPARQEMGTVIEGISRSERRNRNILVICSINTAIALLLVLNIIVSGRARDLNELVPALILQGVCTLALILLLRRHGLRRRWLRLSVESVRESTRMALRIVESEIRDSVVLLGAGCAAVPLFAVITMQLVQSGKMNTRAAVSFGCLVFLVVAVNALIAWRKHTQVLVPRRQRLQQIAAALDE